MSDLFVLYGKLEANTSQFERAMQNADRQLDALESSINAAESHAKALGNTTETTARSFTKLREQASQARDRLNTTAQAFTRGEASARQMRSALIGAENASYRLNTRLKDSAARMNDFIRQSSGFKDFLGSAFGGSLIGSFLGSSGAGAAGVALNAAANGIKSVTVNLAQAGVEAIKTGASFEKTRNALEVAAGSARLAKSELADINEVSKNTAGLRLVSAEEGYTRLRNLGFQANLAKGFIKELGEEKILSGANNEALERIIFNFAQIQSGGQKVSQELREILTQLPSLRVAFFEAFGSLDPQKIQQFFDEDTDKAFQRLVDAMARNKAAAGGLDDAYGKLEDSWVEAQRAFSEPVIEPLTKVLKELTTDVHDNKNAFTTWGENLATVLKFVSNIGESRLVSLALKIRDLTERATFLGLTFGGSMGANADELGNQLRSGAERFKQAATFYSTGVVMPDASSLRPEKLGRTNRTGLLDTPEAPGERTRREANEEFARAQLIEKTRQKSIENSKTLREQELSFTENFYNIQEARLNAHLNRTAQEELTSIRRIGQMKSSAVRAQLNIQSAYFSDMAKKYAGDKDETYKLSAEKNQVLARLNTELITNELNTQKQVAEKEQQILNERRKAQEEFKRLAIDRARTQFEVNSFNSDRALNFAGYSPELFSQARNNIAASYSEISKLTNEFYQSQLQNESLSREQRLNIQMQMQNEQITLAEEQRRKLLDIGDRQYAGLITQLEDYNERVIDSYRNSAGLFSTIGGAFFSPDTFNADSAKNIREALLQTKKLEELQGKLRISKDNERIAVSFMGKGSIDQYAIAAKKFNEAVDASAEFIKQIDEIQSQIRPAFKNFVSLADQISTGNVKAFDEAAKAAMNYRHQLEAASMSADIDHIKGLIEFAEKEGRINDVKEYQFRLTKAVNAERNLGLGQAIEKTNLYAQSLEGLTRHLEDVRSNNPAATAGLQYNAQVGIRQDEIRQYQEIANLKEYIANIDNFSKLDIERAKLQDIINLRRRETESIIAVNTAQSELAANWRLSSEEIQATILTGIASQQTASEMLGNSILNISNVFSNAIQNWDGTISGFFQSVAKGFADLAKSIIADLVKMLIYQSILKLIGSFVGASFGGGGGGTSVGSASASLGGGSSFGSTLSSLGGGSQFFGGFRANGGAVTAGTAYVVGENAPELFVPNRSGMIYNQAQLAAMMPANTNTTKNITVNLNTSFPNVRTRADEQHFKLSANQMAKQMSQMVADSLERNS